MVFKLDEDSVLAYLDSIESYSGGNIVFDDSPMTRMVKRTSDVYMESMTFLKGPLCPQQLKLLLF